MRPFLQRVLSAVALLVGLTPAVPAFAWNSNAHQLIARQAEAQLTPKAAGAVHALLALEPGSTLASVSTWADEHRNPTTAAWHYVNFPRGQCEYVEERDCPEGRCVVSALERQVAMLGSEESIDKRLLALRYVVHLVADTKPSFRSAWTKHQHCIVPAEAFTEPLYEAGKANPTRIACADGLPMGIAGLWSSWRDPSDAGSPTLHSFTMLTINADEHVLMNRFHKPGDEKRMVVILPRGSWKAWLFATPNRMSTAGREQMIRGYPAERLALQSS